MATVKNGLKDLTTIQLIDKSRYIISQIQTNFTPPPQLQQVITATNELYEAHLSAYAKGSQAFVIKREKQAALLHQLRLLASWVSMESAGSASLIVKSGFDVRKGNTRLGIAPPPASVSTVLTKRQGTLLVRWKPVHGKKVYQVEINAGKVMDEAQWKIAAFVRKSKTQIEGLESNRKYWVRVRTLSTAGTSPASAAVPGMVW